MELDKRKQYQQQLSAYIQRGNVSALQAFFADATDDFASLRAIARGEEVNGKYPTIQEMLQANKVIVEKIFPTLKATHVVQEHRGKADNSDIDVTDAKRQLEELLAEVEGLNA